MSKGITVHLAFDDKSTMDLASTSKQAGKALMIAVSSSFGLTGDIRFEAELATTADGFPARRH
ncbi:hypothetical protein [Rhizobium hainanense]|uniref:Uncharacterized protein n=1 Tax=Rhizobium hainanense TaxID=52131 RepID=A0A1C3WM13_9HYPH|nr:hypothetical protein [Rhizobium hainanense]SCB41000.1 hypothetical protein GA0061100_12915 [Rhizobium hainanense]